MCLSHYYCVVVGFRTYFWVPKSKTNQNYLDSGVVNPPYWTSLFIAVLCVYIHWFSLLKPRLLNNSCLTAVRRWSKIQLTWAAPGGISHRHTRLTSGDCTHSGNKYKGKCVFVHVVFIRPADLLVLRWLRKSIYRSLSAALRHILNSFALLIIAS